MRWVTYFREEKCLKYFYYYLASQYYCLHARETASNAIKR